MGSDLAPEHQNGAGTRRVSRLELTFSHDDFALHISGEIVGADCALAICQQAARYFEQQLRQQAAVSFAQAVGAARRTQALIDNAVKPGR